MNGRAPTEPWTEADEFAYSQLGHARADDVVSFKVSSTASKAVDVSTLSDAEFNASWEALGVADTDYERRKREAAAAGVTSGSGRLLRADEAAERRPIHTLDQPVRLEETSSRTGTVGELWNQKRGA